MKTLTKFLSENNNFDYINSSVDALQRKQRLAELRQKFNSQSSFASVNFSNSGYVEDSTGVPSLLDNDFAAERALAEIKQHLIRADLEKTLVGRINARNVITRRNKERKAEMQKEFSKKY